MTMVSPVEPILEDTDLGAVGLLHAGELGDDTLGEHVDDVALGVPLLEQRAQVRAERTHDARREQTAANG